MSGKIYATMTSWKKRISTVQQPIDSLKNQTMRPEKLILCLSSDEISESEVPESVRNDDFVEIMWVKKNYYSWKKYIPIKNHYDDFVVVCDDDVCYYKEYVEDLYKCAESHNFDGVICHACNMCNSKGEPWGGVGDNNNTKEKWVAGGAAMWCPGSFPMKAFDTYGAIMEWRTLQSDECFLMPFLCYNKTNIYTLYPTWVEFYAKCKIVDGSQSCALHNMFFVQPMNFKTNKKNLLLREVVSMLGSEYIDAFKQKFVDFSPVDVSEIVR